MANLTIILLLGIAIGVLAAIMLVPAAYAFAMGAFDASLGFGIAALITAFVGVALYVATRGRMRPISRIQTVAFALIVWTVLPLFAAIPFVAAPMNLSFVSAVFEATSALTTTGATSYPLEKYPMPYIFWFALLQWLGGLLTLITVFTIVAPSGLCGSLTQVAIRGHDSDDFVQTLKTTVVALLPAYGLFTFICFIILWAVGIPFFDAICLALSTLSTGGFVPRVEGLSYYQNSTAEIVLMIFMVVGATSAITHRNLLVSRQLIAFENRESGHVIGACLAIGGILSLWLLFTGSNDVLTIIKQGFFTAVSLITTTGYQITAPGQPIAPYGLIIALVFTGGATFSTAGGIKVYRMALITKQSFRELTRILHPHGISSMRAVGRNYDIQTMKSIWAMFVVYLFLVALIALTLGLLGVDFELAFLSSVAMLSNVGPVVPAGTGAEGVVFFSTAGSAIKIVLVSAMILGRVEILVLLSLGNLTYWRS